MLERGVAGVWVLVMRTLFRMLRMATAGQRKTTYGAAEGALRHARRVRRREERGRRFIAARRVYVQRPPVAQRHHE